MRLLLAASAAALSVIAVALPAGASGFNSTREAKNFAITQERQAEYDTPAYQQRLATIGAQNLAAATKAQADDPARNFANNLCWSMQNGCAGDIRLYNWGPKHYGIVRKVLFTARDGATLSGHVWATRRGPAHRPGVVITDGSVQADEAMYWYAAQTLAKEGYVVLTFDPQGQGQSDTSASGADRMEGVPAQSDGRPFYDGTEDALNFFLSTPRPPLPSGAQLLDRIEPRAEAVPPRESADSTPRTTRCGSCSTVTRSDSPATPTVPPASPTSASGTTA